MKEQTGYKCDFCGKMSSSRSAMMRHEQACRKNPENLSMCARCKFLRRYEDFSYDWHGKPVKRTEMICTATGDSLYHNRVLRFTNKDITYEIVKHSDRKMPNINEGCRYFKQYNPDEK